MNPIVSVVMSVYNNEKYIKYSIESILNQSFTEFEFIIVNDGSTDGSLAIINEYAALDNRIVCVSRKNKGIAASANDGVHLSRGIYIARMDADDISNVNRLKDQVLFLKRNDEINMLCSRAELIGKVDSERAKSWQSLFNVSFDSRTALDTLLDKCVIPNPSVIFKRSVFDKINGYNEKYRYGEDYDFALRALAKGAKMYKLDDKLIKVRIHEESTTAITIKNNDMKNVDVIARIDFVRNYLEKKNPRYLIWGASNGGLLAKELIEKMLPDSQLVSFVDSYKVGELNGVSIIKPEDIGCLKCDYIFIATFPGKDYVSRYLNRTGLKKGKDYISLF